MFEKAQEFHIAKLPFLEFEANIAIALQEGRITAAEFEEFWREYDQLNHGLRVFIANPPESNISIK